MNMGKLKAWASQRSPKSIHFSNSPMNWGVSGCRPSDNLVRSSYCKWEFGILNGIVYVPVNICCMHIYRHPLRTRVTPQSWNQIVGEWSGFSCGWTTVVHPWPVGNRTIRRRGELQLSPTMQNFRSALVGAPPTKNYLLSSRILMAKQTS